MTNYNKKLTMAEAIEIYKFKGQTMFPDTVHNKEIMAKIIHTHLLKLKKQIND